MRLQFFAGSAIALFCIAVQAVFAAPLNEPIKPIPDSLNIDPAKAEIGRQLFHDVRLSANGAVSCASCHDLGKGGVDGKDKSVGFTGKLTGVHTPTVFNSALNIQQFWYRRAHSLAAQIAGAFVN